MSKQRRPCAGCGRTTQVRHPILDVHCCRDCQDDKPDFAMMSGYKATCEYDLTEVDLICLRHVPARFPNHPLLWARYLNRHVLAVAGVKSKAA